MGGMPENAGYQEIVDIQNDINNRAHEAAQALNSTNGAANFENKFNNRANGFPVQNNEGANQRADGFPIPSIDSQKQSIKIGQDVNPNLSVFGAKIENGKFSFKHIGTLEIKDNIKSIKTVEFKQEKRLDGNANMTISIENTDGEKRLAKFYTGPNGDKLIFEDSGKEIIGYNITNQPSNQRADGFPIS